jgi:hypothetical protein
MLERLPDGLRLTLPPPGVSVGGNGLFIVGVVFCLFAGFFTLLIPLLARADPKSEPVPLPLWAGIDFFWIAGLGTLAWGLSMALRKAVLTLSADTLSVTQRSLFDRHDDTWSRDEIEAVACGPSGLEIGGNPAGPSARERPGVPVMELQISLKRGRQAELLAGRDAAELEWIAAILRQDLRAREQEPGETP